MSAYGLTGYIRAVTATLINSDPISRDLVEIRLFSCGAATQIGAFLGSVVMFLVINVLDAFVASSEC